MISLRSVSEHLPSSYTLVIFTERDEMLAMDLPEEDEVHCIIKSNSTALP